MTSLMFETNAVVMFTLIDDLMTILENADQAVSMLQEVGAKHAKFEGVKCNFFRVSIQKYLKSI